MRKHICIIFIISALVDAYIEEIDLPESFTECLEKQSVKNRGREGMSKWCMDSHRMKLTGDKFKHANVSEDTVSWINELLRMSHVDMKLNPHSINKRQASQENPSVYPDVQFPPQPIITNDNSQTANTQNSQGPEYLSDTFQQSLANQQHTGSSQAQRFQPEQTRPFPIIGGNPQTKSQLEVQTQQHVQGGSTQLSQRTFIAQNQLQAPQSQTNPIQNQFPQQSVIQQASQQTVNFAPPQQPTFVQPPQNFQQVNVFQPQPTVISPSLTSAQPSLGMPQIQRPQLRIRKEYRVMTDQERANFHRAIILLKQDTVCTLIYVPHCNEHVCTILSLENISIH